MWPASSFQTAAMLTNAGLRVVDQELEGWVLADEPLVCMQDLGFNYCAKTHNSQSGAIILEAACL